MKEELPSPRMVFSRLAFVGVGVTAVQAAILALAHPSWALFALPTLVAAWGTALETVLRAASLYRIARRRSSGDDAPPPSRAALGDAVVAPRRVARVLLVLWAIEAALLSGIVPSIGPAGPGSALSFLAFLAGLAAGAAPLLVLGFRRVLRPWIVAFPPSETAPIRRERFSRQAAAHAATAVLSTGFLATAVGAIHVETRGVALVLGLSTTVALALVAGLVAARLARGLGADVELLRRSIADAAEQGGSPGIDGWVLADADPLVIDLADALDRVTASIRQSADVEKRVKSSIELTQQKKTVFVASMSHDLRSPLNSIMGFSELLISGIGGELSDGQRGSVAVIQRSGSELLELLNDIIDSARLDASRLPLRREWIPTVELLTKAIRKGRDMVALRTGAGTGFTIEEELQPGLPPLYVDSHRIVQAILCVLRHATLAMDGGAIHIAARTSGGGVRVSITDSGAAISGDDRDRVFQAFRSTTSASGRRIGGMGLSLSLARSLVRAHGGEVQYDASVTAGTTFHVLIPTDGPS